MTSSDTAILVFHTHGGRRYHAARTCPALQSGHDFWDTDDWSGYAIREETAQQAANRGKTPCVACKPVVVEVPLFGQTFGHEPFDEYANTPEGERGVTRIVCARCMQWTRWPEVGLSCGSRITWPCTSAVVLGLAPRPEDTLELTA